jgi:NADPH:quinone reductase-like Zn-dependent oxidoreductase/malonyl CoA-acyl carrier protein transacylase/acyl carrier protein
MSDHLATRPDNAASAANGATATTADRSATQYRPSVYRVPVTGPNQERAAESAKQLIEMFTDVDESEFPGLIEATWRAARGQSRWIIAARNPGEMVANLAEFVLEGNCIASGTHRGGPRRPTFVFSGMGPQWAGMGRTLADVIPTFAEYVGEIDDLLAEHYGKSVWAHLAEQPPGGQLPTGLAQPGNFLIQAALYNLLLAEGIIPEAVVGHSAGEVASAYAAGVYTLSEAAQVAVVRGRLQAQLAGRGAMLAMGVSEGEANELLADYPGISMAAINDNGAVTVAGDADQIAQLDERMRQDQIFAKVLRVEVPYHSPVMDEIADDLTEQMSFIEPKPATLPLYSTVSGALSTGEEWGAPYWPRNVRQPVLFAKAVEAAMADGSRSFIELAPHPVLSQSIDSLAPRDEGISATPLLSRRDNEFEVFVGALGALALEGIGRPPRTASAPLPTPTRAPQQLWDQDRWYDDNRTNAWAVPEVPLLGRRVADHTDEFEVELSLGDQPWIEGHEALGLGPVVPATMWAELLALAATGGEDRSVSLVDLTIVQGLPVFSNPTLVRMEVGGGVARCLSRPVGEPSATWALNAVASIGPAVALNDRPDPQFVRPAGPGLDPEALYALFRLKGLIYSGSFRNLSNVTIDGAGSSDAAPTAGSLVARATIDGGHPFAEGRRAPWVLDAGLQLLIAAARDLGEAMYLPFRLGRVALHRSMDDGKPYHARAEVTSRTEQELVGTIRYFDDAGVLVAELADVICVRNNSDDVARANYLDRNSYALHPVTPAEVVDRFIPAEDEDEELDVAGAELTPEFTAESGGQDPAEPAEPDGLNLPFAVRPVDDPQGLDEVEQPSMNGHVDPAQYWLDAEDGRPVVALHDPPNDLEVIPRGERAHLLWQVPRSDRDDDAITAFELVNRVGRLEDPTITLTLLGSIDQSWILGLRRSAANAFGFPVRAVLATESTPADELSRWIGVTSELEVLLDGPVRLNRLERMDTEALTSWPLGERPAQTCLAYDLPSPARLSVTVEEVDRPGPGEITIENMAVPLTWKDVGKVMGTIGADALSTFAGNNLGLGAVGRVVAAGPDVPYAVGDLVCGAVRRPFRRQVTVNVVDEYVFPLDDSPGSVDPIDRLALMMPWVTTLAALDDIARIQAGERVFIQSGAGALGSVLCRHAVEAGCRVVTSVGTPAKAALLRERFGDRIEIVEARGADIPGALIDAGHDRFDCIVAVVNGEARALLFKQLASRGRYIDIGKASGPDEVQLAVAVDGNRSLCRIDTDQIAADDREWFRDLVERSLAKVGDRANHTPITRYPVAELPTAIMDLARGQTTGSLVIELEHEPEVETGLRSVPAMDPDGVYLITGGYGGVGLMCAQWMISRGARKVVLTGRSGTANERGQASIDLMQQFGADLWVVAADVADREPAVGLLHELREEGPIRGIIHAAGVIADGPFTEIDDDRVRRSFGAKLDGADNLVSGLDGIDGAWDDLDFFLLTSSMSGALGVSIQGTYAAANTGLDGLAERLRSRGANACAMQLGPIEEGGMAADDERNARFFAANGLSMVSPRRLFGVLDLAVINNYATLLTAEIDWQRVGRSEPANASSSVIGHIVAEATAGGDQAGLEQLMMLDQDDRAEVLTITMLGLFTEALGIEDDSLSADASFADMGIDSLAVVEIQVGINEMLQHEVPMARLFIPDGNIGQLAGRISEYLDEAVIDTGGDPAAEQESA